MDTEKERKWQAMRVTTKHGRSCGTYVSQPRSRYSAGEFCKGSYRVMVFYQINTLAVIVAALYAKGGVIYQAYDVRM